MTDIQREELISAYLDGELSPEERARVESWLAESPELRQLHDDLLALRAGMQALPRHKLERDLSSSVVRRAASAMSRSTGGDSSIAKVVPGSRNLWERGSNVRRLLWPALAVAAALVILIYDANQRPDEQQVAQAPSDASSELEPQSGDSFADGASIGAAPEVPATALDRQEAPTAGMPIAGTEQARSRPEANAPAPPAVRPTSRDFAQRAPQSAANRSGAEAFSRGGAATMQKVAPPAAERRVKSSLGDSQLAAGDKADAQPIVMYAVSEAYLQGKEFEKLLDANKIVWESLPSPAEKPGDESLAESSDTAESPASPGGLPAQQRSLYLLQAPRSKVEGVLSQVPNAARLDEGKQQGLPRFTAPQKKLGDESEPGVQVMLVAPQQAAPAAAPAQPAPAQQNR
jgi:hypothetical protein